MWLIELFENIKAKVKAAQEPIPNQKKCEEFAADAYKYCTALYGAPADPQRSYCLYKGIEKQSYCSYSLGGYTIVLSPEIETVEEQCMIIGHEMYHRVTMHRKGLREQVWVDELLAFLTSYWFLKRHGFLDYGILFTEGYKNRPGIIDLKRLYGFRHPSLYIRLKNFGTKYPENFYTEITRLAVALMQIVSGNDLCRLIQAKTLEEWIASLPEEKQYGVYRVLEVSSDGKKLPESQTNLSHFRHALKAKGNRETAISEFQKIACFQPANEIVFFYLALAYEDAQELDKALAAYLQAQALGYSDCWLPSNIGTIFWQKEDYRLAADWYQRAVDCKPDWAMNYYWLGRSLNNLGNVDEAREAWEKTLTLEDNKYTALAQKAIEENPLPGDHS